MSKFPINCKTHFSLLKAFSKCDTLAEKCAEYGYKSCVISDIETISGIVDFHQACKKHKIKPIIGCDFIGFMLIAKNKSGWFDLISCVSDNNLNKLRQLALNKNLLCISNSDSMKNIFGDNHIKYNYEDYATYYVDKDDAECHRVLLCSGMKTTIPAINKKLRSKEDFDNKEFFISDEFYLKRPEELNLTEEQENILSKIDSICEEYDINESPKLPEFKCPDKMSENDYLRSLCRIGWKQRLVDTNKLKNDSQKEEYANRVKYELDVILRANLAGYFLIVQDIVNEVKRNGWLAGPGRGSAAGCLVSYLVGITEVDPIEHGLIFERFYNDGRNTGGNISLPDIDVDVPADHRDDIINYIKSKYGEEKVSQMITFGRLQGRAALKEVLRINDVVSFSEMNEITQHIPNEAEISDQLDVMEEKSIINWALENDGETLSNWCKKEEDGSLSGPLADIFKQAIKIEGTNKSQGKHAAGVIISKENLKDICPMIKDKNDKVIAAFEMRDLETIGHVKFDILGIDLLEKIMEIIGDKNESN